jgi:hypothetical protein
MSTEVLQVMFEKANSNDEQQADDKHGKKDGGGKDHFPEETFSDVMEKLEFSHRFYFFIFKCLIVFSYIFITVEALLSSEKIQSSRHFENFISYIFIALSPSAVNFIYSKNRDQYLTEEQKLRIMKII